MKALSQIIIAIMLCMFTAGCPKSNLSPLEDLNVEQQASTDYVVKAGDIINIQVWGEPRLSGEVLVREDGKFTLPLVNQVEAEGKTTTQIKSALTNGLKEFIPAASVTVSVAHTAPISYFLSGQFMKPGEYRSDKQITFLQAIATGGGFATIC